MALSYTTGELPQADDFERVLRVVGAVEHGPQTHAELAQALGDYRERQGAYYRKAAEIFGLVQLAGPNRVELTDEGLRVLNMTALERKLHLGTRVLELPVFAEIVHELRLADSGLDLQTIRHAVADVVPGTTPKMIERRTQTMLSWLRYFGIVAVDAGRVHLVRIPRETAFEEMLPHSLRRTWAFKTLPLMSGEDPGFTAAEEMSHQYLVEAVTLEKALAAHERLVRDMNRQILDLGVEPKFNGLVDLFLEHQGIQVIFEMKSCSHSNLHDQARVGLAQLYEYRFLHEMPEAKLVLTLEGRPEKSDAWLLPYLTKDRGLYVCWSDGQKGFGFPEGNGPQDVAGIVSGR